jgi:hypothetical protein
MFFPNKKDQPWAVSDLLYGLEDMKDDEGRPIGERRASSAAKTGVPMVLKACPYKDERKGTDMNVSALSQITTYLEPVLRDLGAFRNTQGFEDTSWEIILSAVIDQLNGPARHVLSGKKGPIPAQLAVGHKLAAGYFGAVSRLLAEELLGRGREPTVEVFLDFIKEGRFLIGASEACAGPPVMIAKATSVLFYGSAREKVDSKRVQIAECLTSQIKLGLVWKHFDAATEYELLGSEPTPAHIQCRNSFIESELTARAIGLSGGTPKVQAAHEALVAIVGGSVLNEHPSRRESEETLCKVASRSQGVLEVREDLIESVGSLACQYASMLRRTIDAHEREERRLRKVLGCDESNINIRQNSLLLPRVRSKRWIEAMLGYRIESAGKGPVRFVHHQHEAVEVPVQAL